MTEFDEAPALEYTHGDRVVSSYGSGVVALIVWQMVYAAGFYGPVMVHVEPKETWVRHNEVGTWSYRPDVLRKGTAEADV